MPQLFDFDKLVASNPHVDATRLAKELALYRELLEKGMIRAPGYRLAQPFATRGVRQSKDGKGPHKAIKLRYGL